MATELFYFIIQSLFFLTVLAIKCLIAVPLSHMCYLCLTLPSPHGRWYNGCCESRSHLQEGKKRTHFTKLVKRQITNLARLLTPAITTPLV